MSKKREIIQTSSGGIQMLGLLWNLGRRRNDPPYSNMNSKDGWDYFAQMSAYIAEKMVATIVAEKMENSRSTLTKQSGLCFSCFLS